MIGLIDFTEPKELCHTVHGIIFCVTTPTGIISFDTANLVEPNCIFVPLRRNIKKKNFNFQKVILKLE